MPSTKTHDQFVAAFVSGDNKAKRATNAVTKRNGTMYETTTEGPITKMFYWGTAVAVYNRADQTIQLNTGGYETVTTKAVINAVLGGLGLQARVYQTDHVWQVHRVGMSTLPFKDGQTWKIKSGDLHP